METMITAWGRRSDGGWRGGIRVPHPRTGAQLSIELAVPREFAEQFARQFARAARRAEEVSGGEVGFVQAILPAIGRIAGQVAPTLLPGLAQGLGQLLGGLGGGAAPAPRPEPAPRPAPTPTPAPAPVVPPMPGLAGLLAAGQPAPDLLGAAQILAAAPRFTAWSPQLGQTLRTAIRIVDAEAARRIGDPRARAALAEARRATEERIVRALRLVDAMLDR